jgi:gluconolactonase
MRAHGPIRENITNELMTYFAPPPSWETRIFARLPDRFRRAGRNAWGDINRPQRTTDSFLEGPCFDRSGALCLVDIPFGRLLRVNGHGDWDVLAEYDGWPNGLKMDRDGGLVIADHKHGLMYLEAQSQVVKPLLRSAQRTDYERGSNRVEFRGLNDLTFGPRGELYFTDQGQTGMHDPTGRVYRLGTDGKLECLLDTGPSPNGLALDPSGESLFVAMTRAQQIWRIPLNPDGVVRKVGVFANLPGGMVGPDGIAFDEQGNLYIAQAGSGCIWVLSPAAAPIACIRSAAGTMITNLAFGGPDRRQLYITESEAGVILVADVPVPGLPLHSPALSSIVLAQGSGS